MPGSWIKQHSGSYSSGYIKEPFQLMENCPMWIWQRRKVFGISRWEGRASAGAVLSSREPAHQSLYKKTQMWEKFNFKLILCLTTHQSSRRYCSAETKLCWLGWLQTICSVCVRMTSGRIVKPADCRVNLQGSTCCELCWKCTKANIEHVFYNLINRILACEWARVWYEDDAGDVRNSWELQLHHSAECDALEVRRFNLIFHFFYV